MKNNIKRPSSETAKPKKLLLFPDDPLIDVLKPDYYIVVDPSTLTEIYEDEAAVKGSEGSEDPPPLPVPTELEPPNIDDIKFISKTLFTDKNKNQFVDFVFEIRNHVGDEVIGVNGYGQ
jgi:hypothetical protein